jgi:glycosyltransferase involved in cell wall biosynthesis
VFDYLSAELAVLLADFPLYTDFFRETPGVYFVDPRDETGVGRMLRSIAYDSALEQQGKRGRQYCMTHFGWESQEKQLFAVYERLLEKSSNAITQGTAYTKGK